MFPTPGGNVMTMTTHPALVAALLAGVGLAMLLVVLAFVALLTGAGAIGLQLAVAALAVGGLTRLVSERGERAVVRA